MSVDPRTRRSRHLLTPDNLSTTIQISNLPSDWNQDVVASVLTGSGPITNISTKNDPRTGKLTAVNFDYRTSKDCAMAYDLISRIVKFPCTFERIIPADYKTRIKNGNLNSGLEAQTEVDQRPELSITRDSFPWSYGLELPFQMVTAVPLPRRPINNINHDDSIGSSSAQQQQQQVAAAPSSSSSSSSSKYVTAPIPFPDILSKASQHLPPLKPNVLTIPDQDPVSINLSKIQPLQVIEIISNLKILANQSLSNRPQIEKFLNTNKDISVSISQALLEMGLIDSDVVARVLRVYKNRFQPQSHLVSGANSQLNSPANRNFGLSGMNMGRTPTMTMGMTSSPSPSSSSMNNFPLGGNMNVNPTNTGMGMNMNMNMTTTGMNSMNSMNMSAPQGPLQTQPSAIPPQLTQPVSPSPSPSTTTKPRIDNTKLQKLPENQQEMIRQVLQLTDDQLKQLPAEQRSMVENLRREYLL